MDGEKIIKAVLLTSEIVLLIILAFACAALVDVMTARADTPKQIINGEYITVITTDNGLSDALEITEVPPINRLSEALEQADIVENPYQTISMTDAEAEELRWVIALEAQGEGLEGEIAVCEAIFNRVLSGHWGVGVHGVLSMKGQFSTYKHIGSSKAWAVPGQLEDDAISECMRRGPSTLPSMKYVYFDSMGGVNGRNKIRIGHHVFGAEK